MTTGSSGDRVCAARSYHLAGLVIVALAGCGHDRSSTGGADGGGGDAADGRAPPTISMVTGRGTETCHQRPDAVVVLDYSHDVIQALIPDGSATGYHVVSGVGSTDGTFTIAEVPDGVEYMLAIVTPYGVADYVVTDRHDLQLRYETAYHCQPETQYPTAPTPMHLSLTGMTPYASGDASRDHLEVDAVRFGYRNEVSPEDVVLGDATRPTTATLEWQNGPAPLVDAAAGDDLHVFHLRDDIDRDPRVQQTRTVSHLVDQLDATGTSIQSGVPVAIEGAFQRVAPIQTITWSDERVALGAGYPETSSFAELSVKLTAHPGWYAQRGAPVAGFEVRDATGRAAPVLPVASAAFGDPFPASWKRLLTVVYRRRRTSYTPARELASFREEGIFMLLAFDGSATLPPHPLPPSGVRIGGVDFDAGGRIVFDGQAPVALRWDPVPGATLYQLEVERLSNSGDSTLLTFTTAGTSLQLPAAALADGPPPGKTYYVFTLSAVQSPRDYGAGDLLAGGIPYLRTSVISGRFRLLPSCGDGVVQPPDEQCDTGGESATCNADCTTPVCGDGLRNATAGEDCDTAGEPGACSTLCQLPTPPGVAAIR